LDDFPELNFFEDECCVFFILHLDLISLPKLPFKILKEVEPNSPRRRELGSFFSRQLGYISLG
jgi:hypothetical protein